ncbi:MAG: NADH-quinone oxidoreductase subunit L, partial [Acidimicrobiia bacterium]
MTDLAFQYLWLVIVLPAAGTAFLHFFGSRLGEPRAGHLASAAVGGAFGVAAVAAWPFLRGNGDPRDLVLYEWMPSIGATFELRWDPLAALMTLVVTGVGVLIHVYSVGYMGGDPRYARFFTYLNLFAASMLTLVLAGNFAVLFLGWELVGLCSYLLVSFWFTRTSAAAAGKKAFLVNRVGDIGFMVALMMIFTSFGTLSYAGVLDAAREVLSEGLATAICLLLLVGAAGKSAQLPLYVWLPDAMEGPTPVSALIHAATMVTAGVYLVARAAPLFELSPAASLVVAVVGALTALFAATIAVAQRDIKRVLAYSTISQLGYMFLAVGATAYVAGTFHLMTHAFFKALLFLGAGAVIHGMADQQDMLRMGGLRRTMPITAWTMGIATLAIAGMPPLAGFWSKDEILAAVFARGGVFLLLWGMGLVTALLTAFYMTRQWLLVFWGEPRWEDGVHPHESPRVMTVPLLALAVLSVVGGLVNTPFRLGLEHFLEPSFAGISQAHPSEGMLSFIALGGLSVLAGLAGIVMAVLVYGGKVSGRERFERSLSGAWGLWEQGYRVDAAYGRTVVAPGRRASEWTAFLLDNRVLDGVVNGVGNLVRRFG